MKFMKNFSRANTNSVQKACMVVGFTALLCLFLGGVGIGGDDEGTILFVVLLASSVTFYLFKK